MLKHISNSAKKGSRNLENRFTNSNQPGIDSFAGIVKAIRS